MLPYGIAPTDGTASRRFAAGRRSWTVIVRELLGPLLAPLAPLDRPAWLVGGCVRDALTRRAITDVDIAIDGDAEAAARVLAKAHGAGRFQLSPEFGAWRVQGGPLRFTVDLTPLQGGSIAADLRGRDFTINALAVPVHAEPEIIDLHGGLDDLAARRVRLVRPGAFLADPVRLLRAARIQAEIGGSIDGETVRQARYDAQRVWDVAGERLGEELRRILRLSDAASAVESLDELRVLGALVPALDQARGLSQNPYHHRDVLGHTLEVFRGAQQLTADPEPVFRGSAERVLTALAEPLAEDLNRGQALLFAALLHDIGKPATRAVQANGRVTFMGHDRLGADMSHAMLLRLRASNRLREFVAHCVRQHLPLGFLVHRQPLSQRQIVRYLRLTAPAEVELIVLSAADRLATRGPRTRQSAIDRHLDVARQVLRAHGAIADRGPLDQLVSGDALAGRLGRAPGPWLGELLEAIREEQLVGRVNTEDRAIAFAERWALRGSDSPAARAAGRPRKPLV